MTDITNCRPGSAADRIRSLADTYQLAEILGIHPVTVRDWVRAGRIPVKMRIGHRMKFDLEQVEAALEARQ